MRLNTMSKSLLLGCALALAAYGCGDDEDGHHDVDAGRDAGQQPQDAGGGHDSGQDAGPAAAVTLRIAHLAFGTGVGPIHLCAHSAGGAPPYTLITTDAIATGNFTAPTAPVALPYGTITKHFVLPPIFLAALNNQVVDAYRASDVTAAIQGTQGTCTPNTVDGGVVPPLATATIGASGIQLTPGNAYTVALTGSSGLELLTACNGGPCPQPSFLALTDELSTTSSDARVRTVLLDARFGLTPSFCHNSIVGQPQDISPVVLAAPRLQYATPASLPSYVDTPMLTSAALDVLTLHVDAPLDDGGVNGPCGVSPEVPPAGSYGIFPAGILPNQGLIDTFAAGATAGAATIRPNLPAGAVTSIFIAPQLLQFVEPPIDCDVDAGPCDPVPCDAGSSQACQPTGGPCATPSSSCLWIDVAMPVADSPTP